MSLNEQKGNMYGFVTHTWNTVKGKCLHDCSYCYMKRFPQKDVRFVEGELKTNLGSDNYIFVGSSCDMWAEDIPDEWISMTVRHCREFDNNRYLFQSKNPRRFKDFKYQFPVGARYKDDGTVLCTTIESNRDYPNISAPTTIDERVQEMAHLRNNFMLMVTIEPILDFDLEEFLDMLEYINPDYVNIGADSGGNGLPEPSKEKIEKLLKGLEEITTLITPKKNLKRLFL